MSASPSPWADAEGASVATTAGLSAPRSSFSRLQGGGRYFTLSELTHSDTAVSQRIDNTPLPLQEARLILLVRDVLDPIREHWGLPIRVTSGYRCPELNEEVGGVEDSYHLEGCAADITAIAPDEETRRLRNVELMSLIRAMHLTGHIALTECYLGPKAKYIHIALDKDAIDPYPFI